jgi:ribonuclease BN (tRNA processing enzyme)
MSTAGKGISVTILGSGTCIPSLERSASAVLMTTGGKRLLFDAGAGTMRRLLESGTAVQDIDGIFISHFHPDHSGELASLLFSMKHSVKHSVNDPHEKPLTIIGGPGFKAFYKQLNEIYRGWIHLPEVKIVEFDESGSGHREIFDRLAVTCAGVDHNPESLAFRIETADGVSVTYSGDTDYSESLIRLASNTDLLICEAALPDKMKIKGHMTPSEAGKIASAAKVGRLVLTHFYPECDQADIQGECRKTWTGPLLLAVDLMRINVMRNQITGK